MNTKHIHNELRRAVMRYEACFYTLEAGDKIPIVMNLSKQLLGSDVKRVETFSMTNRHDVCDLFKVSWWKKALEKC